jgi:hypothetical protein
MDILKIIHDSEFIDFLIGNKYKLHEPFANMPTNISEVIMNINLAINEKSKHIIENELERALLYIAKNEKYGSWIVLNYLYSYIFKKNRKLISFNINIEPIIEVLRNKLISQKDILLNNQDWIGSNYKYGLWGHVLNIDSLIKEEIGISII